MPKVPIESVVVENRYRKDLRNLKPLMDSIQEIGLLHAVVLNNDLKLIAGARRLEACRRLGWIEVPAHIVDLDALCLRAEYDENVVREGFLPSEAVAIKRVLEPIEKAKAQERMLEGGKQGGRGHKKARDKLA